MVDNIFRSTRENQTHKINLQSKSKSLNFSKIGLQENKFLPAEGLAITGNRAKYIYRML